MVGETLAAPSTAARPIRIYLAGGIALRGADGTLIGERALAGRQGRRLFVRLAAMHEPVAQEDLADDLWGAERPPGWAVALRSLVSKVRSALAQVAAAGAISSRGGAYALTLPAGTWLDLDAASDAIHRADAAMSAGDMSGACGWALAARAIATRSLLPGDEAEWLDELRRRLADIRLRSLECLAEVWIRRGDFGLAARDADEAIGVDPFRESAHRLLIRAHLAAGQRAEAVRAYEACRRLLDAELGVRPDPQTTALLSSALSSAR